MSTTTIAPLIELQERLAADASGAERMKIEAALAALRQAARQRMDAGVAPADYRRLEAIDGAAEASQSVIAAAWTQYHGNGS